jgi:hypothetical protein
MTFIEVNLFHDKRTNLTFYERHIVDFIGIESWYIYSRGALPNQENELECLRKTTGRFYWHEIVMAFIEEEPFHDMSKKLFVYEKLLRLY